VIAPRHGGVLETVEEGRTGVFYDGPESLAAVVAGFEPGSVDPDVCVKSAQRFAVERFRERLRTVVADAVAAERAPRAPERQISGLLSRRTSRRGAESMRIR
jgi:hypothetical protein